MKLLLALLLVGALTSCATQKPLSLDDLYKNRAALHARTDHIQVGRINVKDESYSDLLARAERLANADAPLGKEIHFIVPQKYRRQYHETRDRRVTINLGPNLTLTQYINELPLDGWFLMPWSEHEIAIVPIEELSRIENEAEQSGPAYPPQGVGSADP